MNVSRRIVKEAVITERPQHFFITGGQVHAIYRRFHGRVEIFKVDDRKQLSDGLEAALQHARLEALHVDFDEVHPVQLQVVDGQALHPLPRHQPACLVIGFNPVCRMSKASAEGERE